MVAVDVDTRERKKLTSRQKKETTATADGLAIVQLRAVGILAVAGQENEESAGKERSQELAPACVEMRRQQRREGGGENNLRVSKANEWWV